MAWHAAPSGKRGRQQTFSDAAIQACLTIKVLFGLPLRQTTGFVASLLKLAGFDWPLPDFSTLCRRQKTLAVQLSYRGSSGPLHLLIDSTGIKVRGEGEWHARKHGGAKRRVWRKVHLAVDEATLEVRAVEVTGSGLGDAPMLPGLLSQIPADEPISSVTADGAYDACACRNAIACRGADAIIPPRRNAKPWKKDSPGAAGRQTARSDDLAECSGKSSWPANATARSFPDPIRDRRTPGPHRHPQPLHRARHPRPATRRLTSAGERGRLAVTASVQQSPTTPKPLDGGD